MIILLDTNIVIDHLEKRQPFSDNAKKLLLGAVKNQHEMLITANSIDNIFYILKRNFTERQIHVGLKQLLNVVNIATVDSDVIIKSLNSNWKDIEDAIQYYTALTANADLIVTRDAAGYEERKIKVLKPEDALALIDGR